MAIVLPGASYQQFPNKTHTLLQHDIICMHTQVGSQAGSLSWGAQSGNPYAHLYTAGNGHTVQGQDLQFRAAANLQGNPYVISWETSDLGEGIWPSPWRPVPWTRAQIEDIVAGLAWMCVRFNIPPVLIPDTKLGRRGIGYHRQGIVPYLVAGALKWSNADYKTCPTDPRVAQLVNEIIPRVQSLVNGDDMIEADHDRIAATMRAEMKRLAQYLALGQGNQAFPSTETVWFGADAVTLPELQPKHTWAFKVSDFATAAGSAADLLRKSAAGGVDIDEAQLAALLVPALLQALNPQQVAEIVADVLGPDIGQQVVDALAAKLAA